MADKGPQLVITIKDGEIHVDSVGFVGNECAEEAIAKELKLRGNLKSMTKKRGQKTRPVRDTSVVDVNI